MALQLDSASGFLQSKGASAVFLGRFTAFFRAVMPALAGSARMPYRRFLPWNVAGGLIWGVAFSLVGYLAGNSYKQVEKTVGRGGAVAVVVVVIALVVWRVRKHRADRRGDPEDAQDARGAERPGPARPETDPRQRPDSGHSHVQPSAWQRAFADSAGMDPC